ncbi:hypothetical protein IC762_17905 [Bradyrhizobium genosp. L]|uniref:DUF6527 family protein n=1 Tax=Bradyrhizobium genosp. L TaxID=83637 RepID=UPI0018A25CC3|nr:DUF6527 family protein [Bradyrhizobium genosp. L]QPF81698.1 hypothetical protein IC762_17905 [Bradyrhizobium genosp. L]
MGQKTIGVRVMPNASGYLDASEIDKPSRYGRATAERVKNTRSGWWQVTAPDGTVGSLNPAVHQIEEHDDGTITVSPSLDYGKRKPGAWHGWLRRGVFDEC